MMYETHVNVGLTLCMGLQWVTLGHAYQIWQLSKGVQGCGNVGVGICSICTVNINSGYANPKQ